MTLAQPYKHHSNSMEKHPDAIAWEEWLNSEEGKKCTEGSAEGVYLQNRLWKAFMAGRAETL